MKRVFLLLAVLITFSTSAQTIQWASRVIEVSSERNLSPNQGLQYLALQVLGVPNKMPQTGESVCAWSPLDTDNLDDEFIKVGFEKPIKIRQVCIAENFNAGAVVQILAYDSTDRAYIIHENKEKAPTTNGRMWNVVVPQTAFAVYAIKIIIASVKIAGYNQIDAIGISETDFPYEAKVNVVKDMPKELLKENLGKTINSRSREVAPIITPDGKTLFFTREGHEKNIGIKKRQDVWVSKLKANGTWGEAENIKEPINTDNHNAVSTISADGKTIYLINVYLPNGTYRPGLSKSKRTHLGWEFPKEVRIADYYNSSPYTEFSLAPNANVLVMSVQRKDSFGGKDLYVSLMKDNGEWSQPFNMGETLNTAENESSPFVGQTPRLFIFRQKAFQDTAIAIFL